MSTRTDKALDLIPTLRAALVELDDALDNLAESDGQDQRSLALSRVVGAEDTVHIVLHQIGQSLTPTPKAPALFF